MIVQSMIQLKNMDGRYNQVQEELMIEKTPPLLIDIMIPLSRLMQVGRGRLSLPMERILLQFAMIPRTQRMTFRQKVCQRHNRQYQRMV